MLPRFFVTRATSQDLTRNIATKKNAGSRSVLITLDLEPDVEEFVRQLAAEKGKDVVNLVNQWLRRDIQFIKRVQ